jgi:hypothetical protein
VGVAVPHWAITNGELYFFTFKGGGPTSTHVLIAKGGGPKTTLMSEVCQGTPCMLRPIASVAGVDVGHRVGLFVVVSGRQGRERAFIQSYVRVGQDIIALRSLYRARARGQLGSLSWRPYR